MYITRRIARAITNFTNLLSMSIVRMAFVPFADNTSCLCVIKSGGLEFSCKFV